MTEYAQRYATRPWAFPELVQLALVLNKLIKIDNVQGAAFWAAIAA